MFLEDFEVIGVKEKFAGLFGIVALIVTFRVNSFALFLGLTVFSAAIGYIMGYASQKIDRRIYKFFTYFILLILLVTPVLVLVYTQSYECLAYQPYEAQNIFTGQTKEFIYGGCGPRTDHPWYYTITDTSPGAAFQNQTS